MRWGLMKKLIGRGGRGVGVKVLVDIFKMVVKKAMMYGMEVYWDGQREMKEKLQVWINRGLRGILGAVRTTPVEALLGEVGMKRVEYELDELVEKWGVRLVRKEERIVWREMEKRNGRSRELEIGFSGKIDKSGVEE